MTMIQTGTFVYINDHFERYKCELDSPPRPCFVNVLQLTLTKKTHIFHVLKITCACYTCNAIQIHTDILIAKTSKFNRKAMKAVIPTRGSRIK